MKQHFILKTPFMKIPSSPESKCRHCRYYAPEGRRGGHCRQLNVTVQSSWKACSLAIPPFAPAWDSLEGIIVWQRQAIAAMQESSTSEHPVQPVAVEVAEVREPLPASLNSVVSVRSLRA
jgi:hypothetical protein